MLRHRTERELWECGLLVECLDRLEEMVQEAREWALLWAAFEKAMEER